MDRTAILPDRVRDPQTYAIIGAAMEVHRILGPGFVESVYRDAMLVELTLRGVGYAAEVELPVYYKAIRLPGSFRADLLCSGPVIVELKALAGLGGLDEQQVINYLKASRIGRGLLINFGRESLQFKRYVLTERGAP